MAEAAKSPTFIPPATGSWTKLVTCRYFKHGACKKGDECRYSHNLTDNKPSERICEYFQKGICAFGDRCWFLHTNPAQNDDSSTNQMLSLPSTSLADPSDARPSGSLTGDNTRRSDHTKTSVKAHDKDQEILFAVERSKGMICGVCLEAVLDKENPEERRFGILTNCSHCYCLTCIRKWRRTAQTGRKFEKSCPECRITSKFFIPSEYWVEDEDQKQEVIQRFMDSMRSKPCRNFDEGRGRCRFGSNCIYKHAFPDGRQDEAQAQRRLKSSNRRNSRHAPQSLNVGISDEVDNVDGRVTTQEAMSEYARALFLQFATETIRMAENEQMM